MKLGVSLSSTSDCQFICVAENSMKTPIGPFILDSKIVDIIKLHNDDGAIQWSGPTIINVSFTYLSTMSPPSHLLVRSRKLQVLLTPIAALPIQLLASISHYSIPCLFERKSDEWMQSLIFSKTCCRVLDINLSDVSRTRSLFLILL